jgi:hypothetical protein
MIKLTCLVAFAGFGAMPLVAQAQSYPVRSDTVVVPFPAGGPNDVVARIVTERMGRMLGQQMVIENVGGAGGTLGSARVAAAQPDGYAEASCGTGALSVITRTAEIWIHLRGIRTAVIWATGLPRRVMRTLSPAAALDQLALWDWDGRIGHSDRQPKRDHSYPTTI